MVNGWKREELEVVINDKTTLATNDFTSGLIESDIGTRTFWAEGWWFTIKSTNGTFYVSGLFKVHIEKKTKEV